jgi:hypothetical protein
MTPYLKSHLVTTLLASVGSWLGLSENPGVQGLPSTAYKGASAILWSR